MDTCETGSQGGTSMDSRYQALLNQPRPRQVKLSKRGRYWLLLLSGILGVVELSLLATLHSHWLRSNSIAELVQKNGVVFYAAVFLPFLPVLYSSALASQKRLLANGEMAIATVTSRFQTSASGPYYVKYKFKDDQGNLLEGESLDSTDLLREGSTMLVYYSGEDTDDQVAQCAAYYEVIVPGFGSDYVDETG